MEQPETQTYPSATVDIGELATTLKIINKIVNNHTTVPILTHCHADISHACVTLRATDLECTGSFNVAADVTLNGATGDARRCTFDPKQLLKLLGKTKGDLLITPAGDKVRFDAKGFSFTLDSFPPSEFPIMRPKVSETGAKTAVTGDAFAHAVKLAALAASHHEASGAILNGVHLSLKDRILLFVATDGFRMVTTDIIALNSVSEAAETVNAARLALIAQTFASVSGLDIVFPETDAKYPTLTIGHSGHFFTLRAIDGTYPNWRNVHPKYGPQTRRISVDPANLLAALKRSKSLGDGSKTWLQVDSRHTIRTLKIEEFGQDGGSSESIVSCEQLTWHPNEVYNISFQPLLTIPLLEVFAKGKLAEITMEFGVSERQVRGVAEVIPTAFTITCGCTTFLQMPIARPERVTSVT